VKASPPLLFETDLAAKEISQPKLFRQQSAHGQQAGEDGDAAANQIRQCAGGII
jgi:hypothetical protein